MQAWHEKFRQSLGYSYQGIAIAVSIIALWLTSACALMALDLETLSAVMVIPAILFQTFLYTGLFITAHDAMHGLLAPHDRKLNDALGALSVLLYALFSFNRIKIEHRKHHAQPGSAQDPDFHDGKHKGFGAWYLHFMLTYVTWRQIAGMALAFNILQHLAGVAPSNLLLFWVTPALLSTLQLFYFGTFLPHREAKAEHVDAHHARTNDFPVFWSFLTCYHFGYHWEHHEFPYVPWWKLPSVRRAMVRARSLAATQAESQRFEAGT
jgi:beta-carotene ketolase (CrtW type)